MMRARVDVLILSMVLAALVLPTMGSAQVEVPDIEFPYVLRIAPGNVLVVHGRVCRDSVTFTWEPEDSLRIEGMAVAPAPPMPPKTYTDGDLAKVYGDVPFIVGLVEQGMAWEQARDEFHRKSLVIRSWMLNTYRAVMDSTGSHEEAKRAVLDSVDRSLFRDETALEITESSIWATWEGTGTERIPLQERQPFRPPPEQVLSPREKAVRFTASTDFRWLAETWTTHYVVVVDRRGRRGMSGDNAAEALRQIEMIGKNKFIDGPLDEFTLEEIILHRTGD